MQKHRPQDWFTISKAQAVTIVRCWHKFPTVFLIGRVKPHGIHHLIKMNIAQRKITVVAHSIVTTNTQCDITPPTSKLTIKLEHTLYALILIITDTTVLTLIDHQPLGIEFCNRLGSQRIDHIEIRVGIE